MSALKRPLPAVFVTAVLLRLAAQVLLGAFVHARTWEYEDVANSILAGHGYTYVLDQKTYVAAESSPLYILITAGVYALTGHSQTVMLVLQALLGGATAALAGWLAGRAVRPEVAWLAGGLVAIDPALLVYAAELHSLTLDALAFVAVISACVALPIRPHWWQAALVGLLVGVGALTRMTVLALTPVIILWANRCRGLRLISLATLMLVGVAALVYSPWPVRNSILLGQFVPSSSESTEWLWRGTNPNATGGSYTSDGRTMLAAAPAEFQRRVADASEAQRIAIYRDAAFAYISAQPFDAMRLYGVKLKAFWWGADTTGDQYPATWTVVYEAWYAAMLILAAVGTWSMWRDARARAIASLILASLLLISATQAAFYVEGRHRFAVEPLIFLLAGVGLSQLAMRARVPGLTTIGLDRVRKDAT
jgi:uncharacterized membrane protein